jgi:RNAPII transcription regulator C-terminal
MRKLPSHWTLIRDAEPFQHGHGCESPRSLWCAVTYSLLQVSRALLVRNHPRALPFVNRLFELFDDAEIGWDAARAIGQVGTVDKVLTKRNHAVIKVSFPRPSCRYQLTSTPQVLHSQKYASNILPKIIQGIKDSTGPSVLSGKGRIDRLLCARSITADYVSRCARRAHQSDSEARLRA